MRRDWVPLFGSIGTSEKMADLSSDEVRLFYLLLLAQCDAWGRITARPRQLNARVWPMLERSAETITRILDELAAAGLVDEHADAEHGPWLQVPDWEDKAGKIGRRDRRGSPLFPAPSPESLRSQSGLSPDHVGTEQSRAEENRREQSRKQSHGVSPDCGEPVDNLERAREVISGLLTSAGLEPNGHAEALTLLVQGNWFGGFPAEAVYARLNRVLEASRGAKTPGGFILHMLREDTAGRSGRIVVKG